MKFSEVPENTEFYWNPRPDEIPSITCKAVKLPENAGFYQSYLEEPDLDDLEYINAIGFDPNTLHYSGYSVPEDAQVELVDTPIKFKDIAVGVYFYSWPHKHYLYMKTEDVYTSRLEDSPTQDVFDMRLVYDPLNSVIVDLEHHGKQKMWYFKPDDYIKLWDDQVW